MSLSRYVTHFWQLHYTSTPTRLDKSTRTRSFSRGLAALLYSGSNRGLFLSFSITTRTRPSSGPQRRWAAQHAPKPTTALRRGGASCPQAAAARMGGGKTTRITFSRIPHRRAAPSFLSLGGSARDFGFGASGRRDLSRNECSIDSPVASGARQRTWARSGAVLCHCRPPPRQRQPSAPRHATPPRRPPGAMAQRESREATAATRHGAQDKKKTTFFSPLRALRPHPPDRLDLNRAHATMRGREGAFSQTKAARRRAAVSVDLSERSRVCPRLHGLPLACA